MKGKFIMKRDKFLGILKAVEGVNEEAVINIEENGWKIMQTSSDYVSMISIDIDRIAFYEYGIDENGEIAINVETLRRFVELTNSEYITILVNGNELENGLEVIANSIKRKFNLFNLNKVYFEDVKEPQITYTAKLQTDKVDEIIKALTLAKDIAEDVILNCNNRLIITATSTIESDELTAEIEPFYVDGEAKSKYNVRDYLLPLLKRMKTLSDIIGSEFLTIEFAENYPIKISISSNEMKAYYLIAPKLMED